MLCFPPRSNTGANVFPHFPLVNSNLKKTRVNTRDVYGVFPPHINTGAKLFPSFNLVNSNLKKYESGLGQIILCLERITMACKLRVVAKALCGDGDRDDGERAAPFPSPPHKSTIIPLHV